jgi:rSAM/selenodomain-associated transferase 1
MGRIPRAGRVKTRLAAGLSLEIAADLYAAFLTDVFACADDACEGEAVDRVFVCALSADEELHDAKRLAPATWRTLAQRGEDLGARLRAAREDVGPGHLVIIGSDAPMMRPARIERAFSLLASNPGRTAVLGPTDDGGYDLIATALPLDELFQDIPWSTGRVMETTRLRAGQAGIALIELEPGYDLDETRDLLRALADPMLPLRSSEAIRKALASPPPWK